MNDDVYSTQNVKPYLLEELKRKLESIPGWGSLEVFVQDWKVTQISTKNIVKTSERVGEKSHSKSA